MIRQLTWCIEWHNDLNVAGWSYGSRAGRLAGLRKRLTGLTLVGPLGSGQCDRCGVLQAASVHGVAVGQVTFCIADRDRKVVDHEAGGQRGEQRVDLRGFMGGVELDEADTGRGGVLLRYFDALDRQRGHGAQYGQYALFGGVRV